MPFPRDPAAECPFGRELSWGIFLWKAADIAFKFVGWCVLLGAVRYGYRKTGDWHLGLLFVILSVLLIMVGTMVVRPALIAVGALTGVQIRPHLPRWAHVAFYVIIVALVAAAVFIALGVVGATVSVLSTLH